MPLVILPITESQWTTNIGHNKTSGQMEIARAIFPIHILTKKDIQSPIKLQGHLFICKRNKIQLFGLFTISFNM